MSFYKREDPDPEDWTPHHSDRTVYKCRHFGCEEVLIHAVKFFNGWPWCQKHYREVTALAMDAMQDNRELEGQEQASRADIERDDTYNRVRR